MHPKFSLPEPAGSTTDKFPTPGCLAVMRHPPVLHRVAILDGQDHVTAFATTRAAARAALREGDRA